MGNVFKPFTGFLKNANVAKVEKVPTNTGGASVLSPTNAQLSARADTFASLKKVETPSPAKSISEITDNASSLSGKKVGGSLQSNTAKLGNDLTPKKSGSGIGKFAAGAGAGVLGLSIVENFLGGSDEPVYPDPTPKPEPEPKFIYDPNTGMFYPFSGAGEGGTAYLSGDGYGESGSVIEETAEILKQYAPWLIGFVAVVVIIALITGNKGKGKKKGGNRK